MKNITDSSIRFSVITEGSLIQTGFLDASLNEPTQHIPYTPVNMYVVQEVEAASIGDILVAERSGEDLIVTLRSLEDSQPHLALKNFLLITVSCTRSHRTASLSVACQLRITHSKAKSPLAHNH